MNGHSCAVLLSVKRVLRLKASRFNRHGTTSLFAALDVATGKVIGLSGRGESKGGLLGSLVADAAAS